MPGTWLAPVFDIPSLKVYDASMKVVLQKFVLFFFFLFLFNVSFFLICPAFAATDNCFSNCCQNSRLDQTKAEYCCFQSQNQTFFLIQTTDKDNLKQVSYHTLSLSSHLNSTLVSLTWHDEMSTQTHAPPLFILNQSFRC